MDLGLDHSGALDRLFVVLDDIQRIDERVGVFFDENSGIHRDDNGIVELVADHQNPHVDIRRTMLAALDRVDEPGQADRPDRINDSPARRVTDRG